jgi:hypothetical protein
VTNVTTKSLHQRTTEGEVWISAKATIQNNTSFSKRIEVRIQGIDAEGFELEDVYLEATFSPGETKDVTNREFMADSILAKISHWQVGSITFLN